MEFKSGAIGYVGHQQVPLACIRVRAAGKLGGVLFHEPGVPGGT